MSTSDESPESKRVVCGACEELLPGTYEGQAAAEQAADEHEASEHPGEGDVVVVAVSSWLVEEEGPEGVVEIATGAQGRLDEGETDDAVWG